jgi:hypothetical protein
MYANADLADCLYDPLHLTPADRRMGAKSPT